VSSGDAYPQDDSPAERGQEMLDAIAQAHSATTGAERLAVQRSLEDAMGMNSAMTGAERKAATREAAGDLFAAMKADADSRVSSVGDSASPAQITSGVPAFTWIGLIVGAGALFAEFPRHSSRLIHLPLWLNVAIVAGALVQLVIVWSSIWRRMSGRNSSKSPVSTQVISVVALAIELLAALAYLVLRLRI